MIIFLWASVQSLYLWQIYTSEDFDKNVFAEATSSVASHFYFQWLFNFEQL